MLRSISFAALLLSSASPAFAQRAEENAVKEAEDAFGSSVGNEKIGLYSANDVRGFSPITAGNIRVEGMAITEHGGFTMRVVNASTIRVGLTAQGYPFPAPTGIADYALRTAGDEAILSTVAYLGPNGGYAVDLDAQIPLIRNQLSLAAGAAYRYEENFPGEDGYVRQAGGVLRWRPSSSIEIKPFYGVLSLVDDRDIPAIFVGGAFLPPEIERSDFGLNAARSETTRQMAGAVGKAVLAPNWLLQAGVFRSEMDTPLVMSEQYRAVGRDGLGQRTLVASADQFAGSTSGEVRSSYALHDGPRIHTFRLGARGRDTSRRYGGASVTSLGAGQIGEIERGALPDFAFGEMTRDDVHQITASAGYELRWAGFAEMSLGIQKSDYRKVIETPGLEPIVSAAAPWLYNGTLAVHLTPKLVAYGGITTGLEESGIAPANAINRNTAPPAIRTDQRDAGIRYSIAPNLNLVAGVFDVRKPYFNLDTDNVYRQLGDVRHRGIELSLAGQPVQGLSLVAGALFLDARVSGDAVESGLIGPRPVGISDRVMRINGDYRLPFADGVSIDVGVTHQSGEVASTAIFAELGGAQFSNDDRTLVDIGARYRTRIGDVPVTLRGQITNLFDTFAWKVSPSAGFRFIDDRRILLQLAADL